MLLPDLTFTTLPLSTRSKSSVVIPEIRFKNNGAETVALKSSGVSSSYLILTYDSLFVTLRYKLLPSVTSSRFAAVLSTAIKIVLQAS